jgi:O-acetyl-ADP-ribose deacetylase (regulator of RNase III)
MQLVLRALEPELVLAFTQSFGFCQGVTVGSGDLLRANVDAVVSPANGFGYLDGGIDLAYRNFFGLGLQRRLQDVIEKKWNGELPIGEAQLLSTGHPRISQIIFAPTMRMPSIIDDVSVVYQATTAALVCAMSAQTPITKLGFPGMGTGIGRVDPFDCCEQMKRAIRELMPEAMRQV